MAELAETTLDRPRSGSNAPLSPLHGPEATLKSRPLPLAASLASALEERRYFILLPFAAIGGLCTCAALPAEPAPALLLAAAVAIIAVLAVVRHSLPGTRVGVLLAAAWFGFLLLPIHGALFGTAMLSRPVYGTYQAKVDAILTETEDEARVVLSEIRPVDTARNLPVRRARVIIGDGPDLAPGDIISGPFRFAPVPGAVIPGGFDTQFHAYFDGWGAYGNSFPAQWDPKLGIHVT